MFPTIIQGLVAGVAFLSCVRATPFPSQLNRTTNFAMNAPQIGVGFDAVQTQQLQDGFRDAMELASYVRDPSIGFMVDHIFPKYFWLSDRATVDGMSCRHQTSCRLNPIADMISCV